MRNLALFIFILFISTACSNNKKQIPQPLLVESIHVDSKQNKQIKQIVFEFNQDIAILGSVPTQAQTKAIQLSSGLNKSCNWRFINLNKLACELNNRLEYLTEYLVSIDTSFVALGKTLSTEKSIVIKTELPKFSLEYPRNWKEFPNEITITNYSNLNISAEALNGKLQLKLPTGEYQNLNVTEQIVYQRTELTITPQQNSYNFPQGHYQIILPKGFKASVNQYALESELIIDDFWFNTEFQFYGFACADSTHVNEVVDINLSDQGVAPCAPEKLYLSFSLPLSRKNPYQLDSTLDWLSGPDYTIRHSTLERRKFYIGLELSGDSEYEIDLGQVKSIAGDPLNDTSIVRFKTQSSTPKWQFEQSFGTVVESSSANLPKFVRRNVEQLHHQTTVIKTAKELQLFLNNQLDAQLSSNIAPITPTETFLQPQKIELKQMLNNSSGLAHVQLTGLGVENRYQHKPTVQSKALMLQSADYNVLAWHGSDLIVQTIGWDAKPIEGAKVKLVCEGNPKPILLAQTSENGIAWVRSSVWQNYAIANQNNQCWLWTQTSSKQAAIELPEYNYNQIEAFSWTAQPVYQPNETVKFGFIARTRSDNGLEVVADLSDYQVSIRPPRSTSEIPLELTDFSQFGFAKSSYQLKQESAVGRYRIILRNKVTKTVQYIGKFTVAEFSPPQFEYLVEAPSEINLGEQLQVDIFARRMNGEALKNAKTTIDMRILREYSKPKTWPKDYEFNSWRDFDYNKSGDEKFEPVKASLDTSGKFKFVSEKFKSTVPFGYIELSTKVIAEDGEVQHKESEVLYFSRAHFIGTRFDDEKRSLQVIAIDKEGNQLSDIPLVIKGYSTNGKEHKKVIFSCNLTKVPNDCPVDENLGEVELVLESGTQSYKWYRNYNFSYKKPVESAKQKQLFKLEVAKGTKYVGDEVEITLNSTLAGNVSFILQAGTVQKVWQQPITAGVNQIKLQVDSSWLPYARLYATLLTDTNYINNEIITQFSVDANAASSPPMQAHLTKQFLSLKEGLKDQITISVRTKQPLPKVQLKLAKQSAEAGSNVQLAIQSDIDADAQLWLVNEAILNLMRITDRNYDYHSKLFSSSAFEDQLSFDTLSKYLVVDTGLGQEFETIEVSGVMMRDGDASGRTQSIQYQARSQLIDNQSTPDFAQSIWLDTLSLKANQQQKLAIKLPQLIGRWKILALTANTQSMSLDSTSVNTFRDIEYFLNTPSVIIESDSAQYSLVQVNKSSAPVNDTLTLWVDGQPSSTIDVQLKANQHKRLSAPLPNLFPGQLLIKVTSKNQPGFVALSEITVKSNTQAVGKAWLVASDKLTKVKLPADYIETSLQLQATDADKLTPDWQRLLNANEKYPHQCWEQTISRALAYQFNPLATEQWNAGIGELNKLISKGKNHLVDGWYSYFQYSYPDSFLTAYTYFVSALLSQTTTPIDVDALKLKELMFEILDSNITEHNNDSITEAKSMALLALAYNGQVSLEQALEIRQSIGRGSTQSSLLQALALKKVGADKTIYSDILSAITNTQYIDDNVSISNKSSDMCLASLIYEKDSPERSSLVHEVLQLQNSNGSFGSTYADALCSYAFKDKLISHTTAQPISFKIDGDIINYQPETSNNHWLNLKYSIDIKDIQSESQGLKVQRKLYVQRQQTWVEVTEQTQLSIGELIKTEIILNSPVTRKHIAITDSVAGGFEPINPQFGNALYSDALDDSWRYGTLIEIRNGKVFWYPNSIVEGNHSFIYFSRVKHSGTFTIAPASVEAMYRTDVHATTKATKVIVE